jgi:adenylate cyclase class 2
MARETEIKLRIENVQEFRRALKRWGARVHGRNGRVHEWNVVFDTRRHALKRRGQLLRIRTEKAALYKHKSAEPKWERTTLTFKCPTYARLKGNVRLRSDVHKVREEFELQVTGREALTEILQGLGMRPWFRYEKYRTTFRLPESHRWANGLIIELDETPIGTFVELEGPASAIDRAARALGYARRDYIVQNYFVLYRDACRRNGTKLGDMVFAKKGRNETARRPSC